MHTLIPASATSDPRARLRPSSLRSPWGDVLVQLARSRGAVTGGIILAVLLVAAVGAPLLTPYDSLSMRPEERLQPPNRRHLFGTDVFGRDLLTRVLYGSRISLRTGVISIMLAVGISASPTYARVVRAAVLGAREQVYVDAARAIGCRDGRIMIRHILPNTVAPIIVLGTLGVAGAIISAAALSYLGLGAQPP